MILPNQTGKLLLVWELLRVFLFCVFTMQKIFHGGRFTQSMIWQEHGFPKTRKCLKARISVYCGECDEDCDPRYHLMDRKKYRIGQKTINNRHYKRREPARDGPDRKERMTHHNLKCWPKYFAEIGWGRKTFEVRFNDRNYRVGDTIELREFDPVRQMYSGLWIFVHVSYVMHGGPAFSVNSHWCIMGIKLPDNHEWPIKFRRRWRKNFSPAC